MYKPEGIRFETQEENETIILFLRKHIVTNTAWILTTILLLILPLFLFPAVVVGGLLPSMITRSLIQLLILVWYLSTFTYFFVNFILWYFNIWIVTNERLIDIDFANLLNKKFAETRIDRLEDVTGRTKGVIGSLFGYGDILAQTAGTENNFQASSIPHPDQVVRVINDLMG
jgi:uncharacterized membrane protein YdbT with pleckstrin-like domain